MDNSNDTLQIHKILQAIRDMGNPFPSSIQEYAGVPYGAILYHLHNLEEQKVVQRTTYICMKANISRWHIVDKWKSMGTEYCEP